MSISLLIIVCIGEIISIFFLSRLSLQKSYHFLKKILKNDKLILFFVSFIYFPGTVIHELSHYIAALILNLHPSEIQLFPSINGKNVKLGHVLYRKYPHDFIRPILVGVAPFVGGLISLWVLVQSTFFPGNTWWQTLLFGYLVLTITANMFSSKQDLVDIGYLIPTGLLVAFLYYLFPIRLDFPFLYQIIPHITYFIQTIQPPLLFSLGIHAILVMLLFIVK